MKSKLDKEEIKLVAVSAEQTGWRNIFCNDNDKTRVEIQCIPAVNIVSGIIEKNLGRKIVMNSEKVVVKYNLLDKEEILHS